MKNFVFTALITSLLIFFINTSLDASIIESHNKAVTLVEYYDYECPHCRRMEPVIESLKAQYPNLRLIYRVTPLLTPTSRYIASIALAAKMQNRKSWIKMHRALMQFNVTPTLADAVHIAKKLNLNSNMLTHVMKNKIIQNQINQNIKSANRYVINNIIYLPIFVFDQSNEQSQAIVLRGEQSRALLSAVIQQLGVSDVQVVKDKKAEKQSKQ